MIHKTFLGLYRKQDIIPLEVKFIMMVALCTYFAFNGFFITKLIVLIIMIFLSIALGRNRSFLLIRLLLLSSIILLIFWTVFFNGITQNTFINDFLLTIVSDEYLNALFRLLGLVIPGYIFMSTSSEQELISTLIRYKAKSEIIVFFVVTFNTIAYFINAYQIISFGYRMRMTKKSVFKKLTNILTTLLFNCIILIMQTKKVYHLYEERIKYSIGNKYYYNNVYKNSQNELTINIKKACYNKKELQALSNISIKILLGQKTLIIGEVGAGKTTLLNIISGIIPNIITCEYEGSVCLDGIPIDSSNVDFVFQHSENSIFYDTVDRQLSHIQNETKQYWLEQFKIHDLQGKAVADLSIGQKKIVSILSCLLSNVPVCLLDEPTAYLDDNAINTFKKLLDTIYNKKFVLVASHDKNIYSYFDNTIKLTFPKHYSKELNYITLDNFTKRESCNQDNLVDIVNCSFKYTDGTVVFSDLNISINKGEIVGILGMNGSGKSTIGKLITESALRKNKNTTIRFIQKCTIAMMLQNTDMQFFTTSVIDEIYFGININSKIKAKAEEILNVFGLVSFKDEPPQFLSEGQKKLLLVASILLSEPDIFIMDEPFDSLDEYNRNNLRSVLKQYMQWTNGERTLIINDQNNADILNIADRYIYLEKRSYNHHITTMEETL